MSDPAQAPPQRDVSLDVARGLLMAWIIMAVHPVFWLRLAPQTPASWALFEMPLIFMIAGAAYFLGERGKALTAGGYLMWFARRATRILVPYWAYAIVCALIVIGFVPSRGGDVGATFAAWLNPIRGGAGHAAPMMNWHLWFVAPFLAVTALMPFLTRVPAPKLPLWLWAAIGTAIMVAANLADTTRLGWAQMIVFYALWAVFGFALAAAPKRAAPTALLIVLVLCIAAMATAYIIWPERFSISMQANKFPPNALFFVFCSAWIALILLIAPRVPKPMVEGLARAGWFKPFMSAGYSIYLWQGLGYAAAAYVGAQFAWNGWMVLPLAVAITVALGIFAAPLERMRWPGGGR